MYSNRIDGIRNVCGLGSALLGGVAASATRNNATYTYTGTLNFSQSFFLAFS